MSREANNMLEKFNNQEKLINYQKLNFKGGNKVDHDFSNFSLLRELFRTIYYRENLIAAAEREQDNFDDMIKILKDYKPKKSDNKKKKDALVINAQNFYDGRKMIVNAFKSKTFPFYLGNYYHDLEEETSESDEEDKLLEDKLLTDLDKVLGPELVKKYFYKNSLREVKKELKNFRHQSKTSVELNNKKALLVVGLLRLENYIRNMSESEVKNKKLDLLKNTVRKIIDAILQLLDADIPPLETEEEAEKRQQGQGLKILTPQQMITRLPILLAQLKAGDNSQKLKNEVRQLLHSLYRSKNLSKTIFNSLMNTT